MYLSIYLSIDIDIRFPLFLQRTVVDAGYLQREYQAPLFLGCWEVHVMFHMLDGPAKSESPADKW